MLTRTTWRLEINLPAGQACFTTRSFWHNASGADQPYYTWMNVGIKAAGNLQFINPGTHYLGHDGKASDWPINPENGRDLSWYDQNNFGSYKSYHVFGRLAEFFGGYWHDDDFGMARCSAYGDKPGQKVWIWGLSRQGMIWEKLLTDTDGQYVEVQSGRLFNQTAEESSLTPFKHREFAPYATDTWTESWEPVKGTKGMVSASPSGAMNVTREADKLTIRISPTRRLHARLEVFDGAQLIHAGEVDLKPMQPFEQILSLATPPTALRVCLGGDKLQFTEGDGDVLSRPTESPVNFDWRSTYGLYLKGKENARERMYPQAREQFSACLNTDPHFLPALVELAALENRRGCPTGALDFARHALSIDAYDPGANYQFGRASAELGHGADAKDAFCIAALSDGWRGAASTELAKEWLREKRYDRALASAQESLDHNRRNLDALQVLASVHRLQSDPAGAESATKALLDLDPLNHFARFERVLRGKACATEFTRFIRNELPHETFLELAGWYRNVGLDQDAARVLELAPRASEVLYWLAFLRRDTDLLARAEAASPAFVFPFRLEAIPVFDWACKQSGAWQPRYYLALVHWHLGNLDTARELLLSCGAEPRFAPFHAACAQVSEECAALRATPTFAESRDYLDRTAMLDEAVLRSLQRASQLDLGEWRFGSMLAKRLLRQPDPTAALGVTAAYANRFPTNSVLALLHAKALVRNARYQAAADLLDRLALLPCEGSTEARATFCEANLMLALERMKARAFADALVLVDHAREWPERLGAGKPFPEEVDERLEDWLAYQCFLGNKSEPEARLALDRILAFGSASHPGGGGGAIIRALALRQAGRATEGEQLLKDWLARAPDNEVACWASAVFTRPATPLPAKVSDLACRVLAAWLRP